jgi:hypothetical protein
VTLQPELRHNFVPRGTLEGGFTARDGTNIGLGADRE